jgi:drug/metabolite transporter (DMT)-like permease
MKSLSHPLFLALLAIVCWGSLATLGTLIIHLPPFYVLGVTFLMGSIPALGQPKKLFVNGKLVVWGILGYYGYHFFLFYSFRFAPALEANLINYLWPMLMILMTPLFFPEKKIKLHHVLGGLMALGGCVVLVWGRGAEFKLENLKGYLLALGAAISWPLYSLGKKKLGESSLHSIGGFCLGAGVLCLLTHAYLGPRVVLQWHDAWKLILMGLGPFGIAFYAWDKSLATGDPRVIGALSYLTPVLSTLGLVVFAEQSMSVGTGVAMLLIIGGASSGLLDFLPSKDLVK